MSALADDLRACLSEALGAPVPAAGEDSEPVRVYRQWLAERNLGLVPITSRRRSIGPARGSRSSTAMPS